MARILVIDDDEDILDAVSLVLITSGHQVRTSRSAASADELVQPESPDMILLDVLLSGQDGREVCRSLKANPLTQHIPIVMVSAHPSAQHSSRDSGADDFLPKPFDITDLEHLVARYT